MLECLPSVGVSSGTEYAKVSLLVCEQLTLIINVLTFLGDILMFISVLPHAVRDKPGKLRRSNAATSVMRCELVIAGGTLLETIFNIFDLQSPKISSGTCRSKHNRYLQVAQFVARTMLEVCYHLGYQSKSLEMGCRRRIPSTLRLMDVYCVMSNCTMLAGSNSMVEHRRCHTCAYMSTQ